MNTPKRYATQAQSIAYDLVMIATRAGSTLMFPFGNLVIEVNPAMARQGLVSQIAKQLTWLEFDGVTPPQFTVAQ